MARTVRAGTWRIHDQLIGLPVTIADARAAIAVYRADPDAARGVLAGAGLTPWTVGGRAISVLFVVHYGPWVLGSYDEVGIGVVVRGPRRRRGVHLVDLPVTESFTRDAGRAIWSLPKWLMSAKVDLTDRAASILIETAPEPSTPPRPLPTMRRDETDTKASGSGYAVKLDGDGGRFVLRARLGVDGVRVPFPVRVRIPLWCVLPDGPRPGVLLRGVMPLRLGGIRFGRGRAQVELGNHPMSERMAALGMTDRPLLTGTAPRLRGKLGDFTAADIVHRSPRRGR